MIKKVIIILNNDEFYDDAQLLARSFFVRADVERVRNEEKKDAGFVPVKTVEISSDGDTATLRLNGLVPSFEGLSLSKGQIHDVFKRAMYKDLAAATGITLPWGFLTGVKPAKRITEIIKSNPGLNEADVRKKFEAMYMVRPDKSKLAFEVAVNEKKILDERCDNHGFSIYIGIPFCPSVCDYCSFGSVPVNSVAQGTVDDYLEALYKEMTVTAEIIKGKYSRVDSIYIGGGTPTTLSETQLKGLAEHISEFFDIDENIEFTVEAGRPDSITGEKLMVLKDSGVNRISVNPQTMNEDTLKRIGRNHSTQDIYKAFELARNLGFDNINADIILALPGEGPEDVRKTLEKIRDLNPDSLTAHALAIKRAAALTKEDLSLQLTKEDMEKMTGYVYEAAAALDMHPYYMYRQQNMAGNLENTGFAKKGKESLYNIVIMEEVQDILAFGAGASSKFIFENGRIERAINVKSIKDYIERNDEMIERKRRLL